MELLELDGSLWRKRGYKGLQPNYLDEISI